VTPIPGTTRDLVRATVAIEGIPVVLIDTAGLRETEDLVESIGVARAREAARTADVVLRVTDCSREAAGETFPLETLAKVVHVHNKIDLVGAAPRMSTIDGETHVWVSATEGAGIELLKRAIVEAVGADGTAEGVFAARARHIECLTTAERHVREAVRQAGVPEFAAEELRLAQAALSRITGEHVADDLLGEIFSRFCIGK
ncbi:MAG TPA: GTPase, partial [Gemmataceae bacterium]